MDGSHFDALVRVLSTRDSRRRVLTRVAALPVLGGLAGILSPGDATGKKRRKRRKRRQRRKREKHDKRQKSRTRCKPRPIATICAGKCGPVKSMQTCGKTVDCGSCDCNPPCGACFACQGNGDAPGTCVPQAGAPCGPGQTCEDGVLQPQGTCDGNGSCLVALPRCLHT